MVRLILSVSLGLVLLSAGVGRPASADDPPKLDPDAKSELAVVVTLRAPADMEYAKVHAIVQKLKARGAAKLSLQALKAGESMSAEVVAEPKTPAKSVSAVVEELLDCGITKIAVERKK